MHLIYPSSYITMYLFLSLNTVLHPATFKFKDLLYFVLFCGEDDDNNNNYYYYYHHHHFFSFKADLFCYFYFSYICLSIKIRNRERFFCEQVYLNTDHISQINVISDLHFSKFKTLQCTSQMLSNVWMHRFLYCKLAGLFTTIQRFIF